MRSTSAPRSRAWCSRCISKRATASRRATFSVEIKLNDRGAKLDQARALVAQTAKQHQVDRQLAADGFRSKTQVAQSAAALEAARASLRTMTIKVENTKIRAPFDGLVDNRYVDVGDYMRVGDKCALIIAPEPFLAVGTVTEQEVGEIRVGDPATAMLVTGETVKGKVRFVCQQSRQTPRAPSASRSNFPTQTTSCATASAPTSTSPCAS